MNTKTKQLKCEICGRSEGIVPHKSHWRDYIIYLKPTHKHNLVCQFCRAKINKGK